MIKFDAKAICKHENRSDSPSFRKGEGVSYTWFECNPAIIYPVVIARILDVLKSSEFPSELVDHHSAPEVDPRGIARLYLSEAKSMPPEAWKYALQPREKFSDPEKITTRAAALNLARLWFTQALHIQIGGNGSPLGVHWINSPAFRS